MGDFSGIKKSGGFTLAKRFIFPTISLMLILSFVLALVLPFIKFVFIGGDEITLEGAFLIATTKNIGGAAFNFESLEIMLGNGAEVYIYSACAAMCFLAVIVFADFLVCVFMAGKFNRAVFKTSIILSAAAVVLLVVINVHFYSLSDIAMKVPGLNLNGACRSLFIIPLAISAAALCFSILTLIVLRNSEDYERSFLGEIFKKNKKKSK